MLPSTTPESAFDDLASLAAHVCEAPMAVVSLLDDDRRCFTAWHGVDGTDTFAFCADVVDSREALEIPDVTLDSRFADHPMVTRGPLLRFYAGAPLIARDNHVLGALCVLDVEPRKLTALQRRHLQILADQVVSNVELQRQALLFVVEEQARSQADAAYRRQQQMLEGVLKHTDVLIYAKTETADL